MPIVSGPGSIDQLVADAAALGHAATARLVRDWTAHGLLDYPQRRPAGKGHGSHKALYSENQRQLFLTLLRHRSDNKIKSLARIPVGIWMYWGDEFVPLHQARRALITWVGDPRASRKEARQTARRIVDQLDNPASTAAARQRLHEVLTDLAYTGSTDFDRLERAVRDVFEPGNGQIRRAVGHPAAPLMADSLIGVTRARLTAVARLVAGQVSDQELRLARQAHLVSYAEYALKQPQLAAQAPPDRPDMYEPVTAENTLSNSCGHLLTALGLTILNPEQVAAANNFPTPRFEFSVAPG